MTTNAVSAALDQLHTVRIPNPTEKRPTRANVVPNCGACQIGRPELFAGCAERLVLVHALCNRDISLIEL